MTSPIEDSISPATLPGARHPWRFLAVTSLISAAIGVIAVTVMDFGVEGKMPTSEYFGGGLIDARTLK